MTYLSWVCYYCQWFFVFFVSSHPGQVQSRQVPSISRHATCVVRLWCKTGERTLDSLAPYLFPDFVLLWLWCLFVSADLSTLLCGQVHYLQPCDTVRFTSCVFLYCLLLLFLSLVCPLPPTYLCLDINALSLASVHWHQPHLPAFAATLWESAFRFNCSAAFSLAWVFFAFHPSMSAYFPLLFRICTDPSKVKLC